MSVQCCNLETEVNFLSGWNNSHYSAYRLISLPKCLRLTELILKNGRTFPKTSFPSFIKQLNVEKKWLVLIHSRERTKHFSTPHFFQKMMLSKWWFVWKSLSYLFFNNNVCFLQSPQLTLPQHKDITAFFFTKVLLQFIDNPNFETTLAFSIGRRANFLT